MLIKAIKGFLRTVKSNLIDISKIKDFKRERAIKRSGKKTIVYIAQYIPAWNKFESIYNELKKREGVNVVILCVPSDIIDGHRTSGDLTVNDTFEYFSSLGYKNCINAVTDENGWFDLKSLNPDYVFYPRPYNHFMPDVYNSANVCKYSKICTIMYGMTMTKEVGKVALNRDFFKDVYCYFAETEYIRKVNKKQFFFTHLFGLRKTLYLGSTALEQIKLDSNKHNGAWDFAGDKFKVLWTPRWTTDLNLGGSNFFEYVKPLMDYAENNFDIAFLFRPHPLMLSNFLSTGEMSEQQIEEFKQQCETIQNIQLDKEKEYVATFWNSDLLITDISGILPEYFVTGKPIIYCANNMILTPAKHTKKMLAGCYVVKTKEELINRMKEISSGKDDLKEKRRQLIDELWGEALYNSTKNIVDFIVKK